MTTGPMPGFLPALREVWQEPEARRFTVFVFISMLAYSAQDLILEPFAGTVFGMTPGESTQLAGIQHGGVLLGMLIVAVSGSVARLGGVGTLRVWAVGACLASALALFGIAFGGAASADWPLRANVFALGVSNGAFAIAAIASMMTLSSSGRAGREGLRMGLWGAAQAIAFGLGGFLGTVAVDVARHLLAEPNLAYGLVFSGEAALFVVAALLAARINPPQPALRQPAPAFGDIAVAQVLGGR